MEDVEGDGLCLVLSDKRLDGRESPPTAGLQCRREKRTARTAMGCTCVPTIPQPMDVLKGMSASARFSD